MSVSAHTKKFWSLVSVALAFALAAALSLSAQGIYGSLRGEVLDPQGAVVPGAKVTVTNPDTGVKTEVETTSVGRFFVPNLLAGTYTVTVEVRGFKKLVRKGVEVRGSQVSELSLALELGATTQTIEVVGGAELVPTTTSDIAASWGSRTVTDLPNLAAQDLSGNPLNLAVLLPGVTSQPGGVVGVGGSIGGNRPRDNNFVLDGVDNNDVAVTGPLQPVIQDAVEEFTLITNQFSAEYGHSTAGQFIVTTRAGTNDLHGRAWWFLQNRHLDATDSLTDSAITSGQIPGKPPRDYDRLGGQLGGPLKKDKWFLFGAFQFARFGFAGLGSNAFSAPTAAGYTTLAGLACARPVPLGVLTAFVPPAPVATGTLTLSPACASASIPVGTIAVPLLTSIHTWDWQVNMDYNSKRHRVAGRFLYNRVRQADVPQLSAFSGSLFTDNRSVTFSDVFTINPSVINEFRFGYRRNSFGISVPNPTPPGALDVFPNIEIDDLNLSIGPDGNAPQSANQNIYQLVDTVSYTHGAHTFKFGLDLRDIISPNDFLPRARAEYDWSSLDTYIRDILPDGRNGALRGVGSGFFALNQRAFFGFVQDDWKITPRFTLNLGLRYEWAQPARDNKLQALNAIANLPGTFVFRNPKSDRNNWGPRVGFAWDVFGDHKTAVRGGIGMAYDVVFGNLPLLQLPPQLQTELDASDFVGAPCPQFGGLAWCLSPTGANFMATGGLPPVLTGICATQAACRAITQAFVPDEVKPKTLTWSLAIQREFLKSWTVELRYVGTRGLELPMQIRRNARIPITLPSPVQGLIAGSLPVFTSLSQVPANLLGALNLANLCSAASFNDSGACGRRRFFRSDGFNANVTAFDPVGTSIYHGGSIQVEHRAGRGLFLRGNYTFSKTIDLITNELFVSFLNPRRVYDHVDLRNNRGLSDINRKHHFAVSAIWDVPKVKTDSALLKGLLHGWEVTGVFLAETGQPVTILNPDDMNGNGDFAGDRAFFNPNGAPGVGTTSSWVCITGAGATFIVPQFDPTCNPTMAPPPPLGTVTCPNGLLSSTGWCTDMIVGYVADANARFIAVGPGVRTNLGRNTFISPGINNFNIGVYKNTYWNAEKGRYVRFSLEMVNAFNHPQPIIGGGSIFINLNNSFSFPYATPGDPGFLNPGANFSGGNRFMQLGLKVVF